MNHLTENAINFQIEKKFDGGKVNYSELMEVCQGGPAIGKLSINNQRVCNKARFGGPLIYEAGFIYIPMFKRGFFSPGFILVKINVATLNMTKISKVMPVIVLDRIEGEQIYFFEDMKKIKPNHISAK
jgi:hypothetical protein